MVGILTGLGHRPGEAVPSAPKPGFATGRGRNCGQGGAPAPHADHGNPSIRFSAAGWLPVVARGRDVDSLSVHNNVPIWPVSGASGQCGSLRVVLGW
ncbi:hypothetical protein Ga0080574_TMP4350 [Salipiger abyssi]|uniref:Uncharacterized protein n=1 Tax=Salipiger abyssi TaxID=1250539 RepID=A0A1P8UZ55_9RHOB|nr:hypothetical protein Ga0080574_TMP4350 [Salipiger abyssi]